MAGLIQLDLMAAELWQEHVKDLTRHLAGLFLPTRLSLYTYNLFNKTKVGPRSRREPLKSKGIRKEPQGIQYKRIMITLQSFKKELTVVCRTQLITIGQNFFNHMCPLA